MAILGTEKRHRMVARESESVEAAVSAWCETKDVFEKNSILLRDNLLIY